MPNNPSDDHVKFGPCQCDPDVEEYEMRRSDEDCPTDVKAQYICTTCGTKVELVVDPYDDASTRGIRLTGRVGWTDG